MSKKVNLAERDSKIIELRGEGKTAKAIADEVGVCPQTVFNVLTKYGLHEPKKNTKKSTSVKTKQIKHKKCPVCKAVNNPKEAKFCCMCGSDIRNKSDNSVEEVRDTILETITYIEDANK